VIRKVGRGKYSEVFEGINVVNDQVNNLTRGELESPSGSASVAMLALHRRGGLRLNVCGGGIPYD
jgi:hypothetical protein